MIDLKPIDIEDAVQKFLNSNGIKAGAAPVPSTLKPPYCVAERTGGTRFGIVYDRHSVTVDCYAKTWTKAQELASDALNAVMNMPYSEVDGATVYDAEVSAHPYNNPDPLHADVPRSSFAVIVSTRIADRD